MGKPLVDTFITEVSQDTWIFFPWDTGLSFQPPIRDGARRDQDGMMGHERTAGLHVAHAHSGHGAYGAPVRIGPGQCLTATSVGPVPGRRSLDRRAS